MTVANAFSSYIDKIYIKNVHVLDKVFRSFIPSSVSYEDIMKID